MRRPAQAVGALRRLVVALARHFRMLRVHMMTGALALLAASGPALAAGVVKVALACHTGMATFAEAAVPEKA